MNYIDQIKAFWLLDKVYSFSGNESRLYFYLLEQSNLLYWKNPLTNADGYTAAVVGISVNTLKTSRNKLQQAGLIRFKSGGKGARDKSLYEILSSDEIIIKVSNKVSKSDTLSSETLTPYPYPYREKSNESFDTNKKQKQKQNYPPLYSPLSEDPGGCLSNGSRVSESSADPPTKAGYSGPLKRLQEDQILFEGLAIQYSSQLTRADFKHFCHQWDLSQEAQGGWEEKDKKQLSATLKKYLNSVIYRKKREKKIPQEDAYDIRKSTIRKLG